MNLLITGAAGYIGGSVLADILSRTDGPVKTLKSISAAVRTEEQAQSLSKLGVKVVQLDLTSETAVREAVLRDEIDLVVHTAGCLDSRLAANLIKALGQRRKVSGKEVFFVHTSVANVFSAMNGWPFGALKDSGAIFDKQKEIKAPHPVRDVDVLVVELSKAEGVTATNVVVPGIYGRGTGECRKLSVSIPAYVRTSIAQKIVHKFDEDGSPPLTHISDLAAVYVLIIEKLLQQEPIPTGEKGYYVAMAHKTSWWEVMDRLAKILYARGLVTQSKVEVWPSDEMAAESLGFPVMFIRALGISSGELVPVNAYQLGWQPKWDEQRYLDSMDDEIEAAMSDNLAPTLFAMLET